MSIPEVLFSLSGRISRSEYWLKGTLIMLAFTVPYTLLVEFGPRSYGARVLFIILGVWSFWPWLAILLKRWHDRDRSAWWLLTLLIPFLGSFFLIWILIEVWFLKGTDGTNRFGQDPLQREGEADQPEPRSEGVGGWLLLFCLALTVFNPIITLVNFASGFPENVEYFDQFPGLLVITAIDVLLSLGLMGFSVYAGTGLWSIRPGAVQMAKRFLLCSLAYLAVASILPFMAGLPSAANEVMAVVVFKDVFRGIAYFAIWYSYLNKSKRVRATYQS